MTHIDGTPWQEGDLWTNNRGVTFRLERVTGLPVLVWVKVDYQLPELIALDLVAQ